LKFRTELALFLEDTEPEAEVSEIQKRFSRSQKKSKTENLMTFLHSEEGADQKLPDPHLC